MGSQATSWVWWKPSSHSATVTALTVAIGFQEGFGGPLFATALVLACIV